MFKTTGTLSFLGRLASVKSMKFDIIQIVIYCIESLRQVHEYGLSKTSIA